METNSNTNKNDLNINEIKFESLLNLNIQDEKIQNFLTTFPNYTKKVLIQYTYINYLEHGISLCFCDNILQQIFFYNQGIQNYQQYKGLLPYNLNFQMKNKNIVEYLGDTTKKGGGTHPIWLSYDHLGFEVTFLGKVWTDTENPITHICIFNKEQNISQSYYCSVCLKLITDNNFKCKCELVKYCSSQCKNVHINFHQKYCKN
jgi:hypothetical protein